MSVPRYQFGLFVILVLYYFEGCFLNKCVWSCGLIWLDEIVVIIFNKKITTILLIYIVSCQEINQLENIF
jgi:hypothetical protein